MKSLLSKISNIISIVIIVVALVILVSAVFTRSGDVPMVMGHSFMKVLTGSMEPEIKADSIVVTKEVAAEEIQVGDVISYYSADPELLGMPVTHRVTDIKKVDGKLYFITKGDVNVLEDKNPVMADEVIGKVVFSSHFLGLLVKWITKPYVFFPLVIIPLLIIVASNVRGTILSARQIAKEEEEEAVRRIMEEIKRKKEEE